MNFLKHIIHAFNHTRHAALVRYLAYLAGLFYFAVANDLFWTSRNDWHTPIMTVIFNAPIFIFVAAIVCTYVYYYTKEKTCCHTPADASGMSSLSEESSANNDEMS